MTLEEKFRNVTEPKMASNCQKKASRFYCYMWIRRKLKYVQETTLSANLLEQVGAPAQSTLRSTALTLCYSTAEYACSVWERSAHPKKSDPAINATCLVVTGCMKPTPTDSLYILSGIAPSDIRRSAASSRERQRQTTDERHPLFGQVSANRRLKSRKKLPHRSRTQWS